MGTSVKSLMLSAIIAAPLALLASACGTATESEVAGASAMSSAPAPEIATVETSSAPAATPAPQYRIGDLDPISNEERLLVFQAYERSISSCAKAAGVQYDAAVLPTVAEFAESQRLAYERDNFDDEALIAKYLYSWPVEIVVERDPRLDDPANGELRKCAEIAFASLSLEDGSLQQTPYDLLLAQGEQYGAALDQLKEERARWATCMEGRGFKGADLAISPKSWSVPTEVTADLALADAQCREDVGYSKKLVELLTSSTAEWAAGNATFLETLRDARQAQLEAARSIVSQG